MERNVVVPKVFPGSIRMREVVHGAAAESEEMIVAALQRTELGQNPQMPLADQRRAVTGFLQERGQGGMLGRQANLRISRQRLLQANAQPILVTACDQCHACGGAYG